MGGLGYRKDDFMNNTDLKELLKTITPTKNELDQMKHTVTSISNLLKNNVAGNVKLAELHIGGSYAKGTIISGRKEVDLVVVISPKSKNKFFYQDLANLSMNYIENTFYLQYYDSLLNQTVDSKIVRNYERNTLSMTDKNGVSVDFLIKFKKEQLVATTKKEVENFYLERDTQQLKFIDEANKEYPLFKKSVMLVKKLRDDENCHILKSYMIEVIMYYALSHYLKGNDYVGYMNAFFKGLQDFKSKKKIEVTGAMYKKIGTKNSSYATGDYVVIDVANKSNNVAMYIKDITQVTEFYCKYVNEFKNDTKKLSTTKALVGNKECKVLIGLFYCDSSQDTFEWRLIAKDGTRKGAKNSCRWTDASDEVQILLRAYAKAINYATSQGAKTLILELAQRDYDIIANNNIDGSYIGEEKANNIASLEGNANKKGITVKYKKK